MTDRKVLERIVTLLNPRHNPVEADAREAWELARTATNSPPEEPPSVSDKVAAFTVAINALSASRVAIRLAMQCIQAILQGTFSEPEKLAAIQGAYDRRADREGM